MTTQNQQASGIFNYQHQLHQHQQLLKHNNPRPTRRHYSHYQLHHHNKPDSEVLNQQDNPSIPHTPVNVTPTTPVKPISNKKI
jgi:hypothetical protein